METYTHCITTSRSLSNCLILEYKLTGAADKSTLQFHTEACRILSIIGLNQVLKRRVMSKKRIGTLALVLRKKFTSTMSSLEHIMSQLIQCGEQKRSPLYLISL